jgi:hypothetical protein
VLPGSIAYQQRNPGKPLRRHEIMRVLVQFADSHRGVTPPEVALWKLFQAEEARCYYAKRKRRPKKPPKLMAWTTFRTHLRKLQDDDNLICLEDGVIQILDAAWCPGKNLRHYLN